MAKKDKKVEVKEEVVEEVVVEPVEEPTEGKTFRDAHGRTWLLDDEGNRVKRVYL